MGKRLILPILCLIFLSTNVFADNGDIYVDGRAPTGHLYYDEGVLLDETVETDFVGAGIAAVVSGDTTTITVGGGGGGAPTDATYITQTANGSLSAEQAMGALATGLVKNATTTGIQSIAVADTDYDSSVTNEINTITADDSGTTTGLAITVAGGGINATTRSGDTITVTGTEVDGSTSNEFNTIQGDDNTATTGLAISIDGAGIVTTDVVGDILTVTGTEADTLDSVSDRNATTDQVLTSGGFTTSGNITGAIVNATTFTDGTLEATGGSLTNVKLGSLTDNGFVKTSSGDGTLSVDTNTYVVTGTALLLDQTSPQTIVNGVPLMTTAVDGEGSGSQLVNMDFVNLAVASIELFEFFHDSKSADLDPLGGIDTYLMQNTSDTAGTVASAAVPTGAAVNIFNFATPTNQPHIDRLVAGLYDCHFHVSRSVSGTRTVTLYYELYRYETDSTQTPLGTSEIITITTTPTGRDTHLELTSEVILDVTDRIIVKWWATVTGVGGANPTVTIDTGGANNSHFSVLINPIDLTSIFVPYTGAENDVDLGVHNLTVGNGNTVGTTTYKWLFDETNGDISTTAKVGIGTTTIPHGGVGYAKFAFDGPNENVAGPHVQFTTSSDNYPLMQILNWRHDDISIRFDSYWDGANKSSDTGSNYAIFKVSNLFKIMYDSGVAKGAAISWNNGIILNTSGLVTIPNTVTAGTVTDGTIILTGGTLSGVTAGTIGTLTSTTGTIANLNTTSGTIGTLLSTAGTVTTLTSSTFSATTGTITGLIAGTILLDNIPASDDTWNGIVINSTVGENVVKNDVLYLKSDSKYWLADGDAEATTKGALVMSTGTIAADAAGELLVKGYMRDDGDFAYTVGATLYVSLTPGDPTETLPPAAGDFVRVAGWAESADVVRFDPSKDYLERV